MRTRTIGLFIFFGFTTQGFGQESDINSKYQVSEVLTQKSYIKASNSGDGDQFGRSHDVSGNTMVVGAYLERSNASGINNGESDNSASNSGAVYVLVKVNGVWAQQAYIKASNSQINDSFGESVAISGDTIVVGVPREDSNSTGVNNNQSNDIAPDSGAVYVFTRTEGIWSQQAYIKASNTEADDAFGVYVDIDGDTLIVGASGESSDATGVNGDQSNNMAPNSGAVYVFKRNMGMWVQDAYIKSSNTDTEDYFGTRLAISGDSIVVASFLEDSNATGINNDDSDNSAIQTGAAYVFVKDMVGDWSQQAYLKAGNSGAEDRFGQSVDINADTVVVGARYEASDTSGVNTMDNDLAEEAGAVYVFTRIVDQWSQQAYIKPSNTNIEQHFGYSIALNGDDMIVGAIGEKSNSIGVNSNQTDDSLTFAGAGYIFKRSNDTWIQKEYIKASNTDGGDFFGFSVSLSQDYFSIGSAAEDSDTDGVNNPGQDDNSLFNAGAVYTFSYLEDNIFANGFE